MINYRGEILKKIFKFIFISFSIIGILFSLTGCNNPNGDERDLKQKIDAEISYLDGELTNIANELNNINYAKYRVDVQETQNISSDNENSESGGGSSSQSGGSKEEGSSEGGNSKGSESKEKSNDITSVYSMKSNTILGREANVNWDDLKSKIESLYTSWTTISVDLKELGVSSEQINEINSSIDNLAVAVKNKDNISTIEYVTKIYEHLPMFANKCELDLKQSILICKYNLLVCYKYAIQEDWEHLKNSVSDLKMSFSNVSSRKSEYKGKEVNIENANIIINEMGNSSVIMDRNIFLIKYRNLIQEMNLIL